MSDPLLALSRLHNACMTIPADVICTWDTRDSAYMGVSNNFFPRNILPLPLWGTCDHSVIKCNYSPLFLEEILIENSLAHTLPDK